ncbi:MAG: metallophosphoesterase [Bacilli bacterium]|nr:metallophosphoesterase [Bacilli bacterium]
MKKWFKFFISFILIIMGIILYARFIGTMGFSTKEYTIYNNKLPNGFDGIKVVHFSDIHYGRAINNSKIDKIVDEINLINPDIVIFTGDLIDKDADLNNSHYDYLTKAFSKINSRYGKYAVLGNHDYKNKDSVIDIYNNSDFIYLENSYDIIYNQNMEKIFIGGIGNVSYNSDNIEKTMEYFKENEDIDYKIILTHEPDITDNIVNNYNVSLILAGHSHNGQIRLPKIGALITPMHAKKYYDEYYNVNDTDIYISSGIGVSTVNFRLFNRPSINFYRINKKR